MKEFSTWETFCKKIAKMETSNLMINKLRLDTMFTFIYGFHSNYRKKTLISNYWHQNTTQWSTMECQEAKKLFAALGARNKRFLSKDAAEDLIHGKLTQEFFSFGKINQFKKDINFCRYQMASINKLFCFPYQSKDSSNND